MERVNVVIDSKVYQRLLVSISHTMLKTVNQDEFFKLILKEIGKNILASRIYIFELKEKKLWTNTYEWCADDIDPSIDILQNIREEDIEFFFKELRTGNPFIFENVSQIQDKETSLYLSVQDILSICIIPIYHDHKISGFFGIDMCVNHATWSPETVDLLVAMTNLISSAMGHFIVKHQLEKQSYEFKNILDSFPDPVYISDMDNYKLLFCNKITRDIFPDATLPDVTCHKLFENLDEPCSFCSNKLFDADYTPITWIRHNEIAGRTYSLIDCCVEWQGRKKARFSVAHDISDILAAEQREISATEANASKNYFLTNMSHELRTPLNGILGLVHLIRKTCVDDNTKAYLSKINASTNTLLSLINNILDCTNLDSKSIIIKNNPITIQSILQNVVDTLKYSATEKNLVLDCNIDENLSFNIMGDFPRLTQVIMNLIINAIKFTDTGVITIDCNVKEKTEMHATIEIKVKDTGIGIKKSEFNTIFDVFSQSDSSLTRNYGGAGMGLAISHRLIKLMGGNIDIDSTINKGSTFTVTIPFFIASEDITPCKNRNICQLKNLKNVRILVVEDNAINQLIIEEILKNEECHVDIAQDGEQCIAMLENSNYDIVLMDIQMPIMDGLTATKFIRKKFSPQELPVVALTAHAQESDKIDSFEAGMQEHITKPIDIKGLISTLIDCLNARHPHTL